MSDILESAREHFNKKDIKRIEIPEWETKDGKPFVIYAKPLTLAEKRRLTRDTKPDDVTLFANVLILYISPAPASTLPPDTKRPSNNSV